MTQAQGIEDLCAGGDQAYNGLRPVGSVALMLRLLLRTVVGSTDA